MNISPKNQANAYAALSSGAVAAFLVREAKFRLGIDLTLDEAGYIVAGCIAAFLFAGRKLGGKPDTPAS